MNTVWRRGGADQPSVGVGAPRRSSGRQTFSRAQVTEASATLPAARRLPRTTPHPRRAGVRRGGGRPACRRPKTTGGPPAATGISGCGHESSPGGGQPLEITTDGAALPPARESQGRGQLAPGESVLAWFEPDLDHRLHYAPGLVVLTDRRVPAADGESGWGSWPLGED